MSRIVDTKAYLDTAVSLLHSGKDHIPVPVSGDSMCPFLRPGDTVYLSSPSGSHRPGDIVLYRRKNGAYILHRIIRTGKGSIVLICGDNQTVLEPVNAPEQILAQVACVERKGRHISPKSVTWRFYATFWRWLRIFRPTLTKLYKMLKTR